MQRVNQQRDNLVLRGNLARRRRGSPSAAAAAAAGDGKGYKEQQIVANWRGELTRRQTPLTPG